MDRHAGRAIRESSASDEFLESNDAISKLNDLLKRSPDSEINLNRVSDLLPFFTETKSRMARNQSFHQGAEGVSIISLPKAHRSANESELVRYGLEPLLISGMLSEDEAKTIASRLGCDFTRSASAADRFEKRIKSESGRTYRVFTNCAYGGVRSLNVAVANGELLAKEKR